ncbi:MAG: hypothetical protein WCY18_08450 [Methanofastidiosum sp.]
MVHMAVEKNYSDWLQVIRDNKSKTKANDMKGEIGTALKTIDKMYGHGAANRAMAQCELPELGWKNFEELI